MFEHFFSVTFLVIFFLGSSFCRPDGAPLEACEEMMPHHWVADAELPLPYIVWLDKIEVLGNETVRITLETMEGGPAFFRGFLIQAREIEAGEWFPQGFFSPSISENDARPLDCAGVSASTMTHLHNRDKTKVEFEWNPPNIDGQFEIILSIVEKFDTCWTKGSTTQVGVTKVNITETTTTMGTTTTEATTTTTMGTTTTEATTTTTTEATTTISSTTENNFAIQFLYFPLFFLSIVKCLF